MTRFDHYTRGERKQMATQDEIERMEKEIDRETTRKILEIRRQVEAIAAYMKKQHQEERPSTPQAAFGITVLAALWSLGLCLAAAGAAVAYRVFMAVSGALAGAGF